MTRSKLHNLASFFSCYLRIRRRPTLYSCEDEPHVKWLKECPAQNKHSVNSNSDWFLKEEKLVGEFELRKIQQNICFHIESFPGGLDTRESACNAVDPGLIPRSGRSPGGMNGYPLQYSCLENSMDRGA